jgi:undecaprenyl diphosphate synthase
LATSSTRKSRLELTREEQELYDQIDPGRLPKHIAVIMDGNGRWAHQRNLPRIKGHKASIPAVRHTVEGCADLGIRALTVYAFSTENWKRPERETGTLMALLRQYFRVEIKTVAKHDLCIKVLGAIHELSPGIQRDVETIVARSQNNQGMTFNVAINYSGRQDILAAFRKAIEAGEDPQTMDESVFANYLSTAGQPDPDLVIRTSGEMRISNFLLWQIAYSEIWTTPTFWPDFRRPDLYRGILAYQARHRRFGGV